MTNAPADLLSLRHQLAAVTGLTDPADLGIVGNAAHAASGGYHEGRTDLANAGVYHVAARAGATTEDYSVRLSRDRAGLTESASAMDIGDDWPHGGRAAWLRFNAALVKALKAGDTALAAVRAVNYSLDGVTKHRIDRQNGWTLQSTSDTVTIHTHVEFYRDTEGKRSAAIARLVELAQQAITRPQEDDVALTDDDIRRIAAAVVGPTALLLAQGSDGDGYLSAPVNAAKTAAKPYAAMASKNLEAQLTKVGVPTVDPAVLQAAVSKALADPAVLAALAKAVNDEAAQRRKDWN